MYEYLLGDLLLGVMWILLFLYKRTLRKSMIWGGLIYVFLLTIAVTLTLILSKYFDLVWRYIPDFWNPPTLFNLGNITGIDGVEGVLFAFFAGGIVSVLYEVLFNRNVINVKTKHHVFSLIMFIIAYVIVSFLGFNIIYNLIIASIVGGLVIIAQRRDLLTHSFYGALAFGIFYFIFFLIINLIFPYAVEKYWSLENLSNVLVSGVPIEELLYAVSFGFMWASLYEYVHGKKIK